MRLSNRGRPQHDKRFNRFPGTSPSREPVAKWLGLIGENSDPLYPLRQAGQDMTSNQMVTHKPLNKVHILKHEIDNGLSNITDWRRKRWLP